MTGANAKIKRIYVGDKQVRPSGWSPGANTIAYYPLTSISTVNDMSGNSRNLTNHSVSFNTYNGVNCAYFNGSSQYLNQDSVNMGLFSGQLTVSSWVKGTGAVTTSIWYGKPYQGFYIIPKTTGIYTDLGVNTYNTVNGTMSYSSMATGWHLITLTWKGSTCKIYADNGSNSITINATIQTQTSSKLFIGAVGNDVDGTRAFFNGYISNVILENKVWTAQEIAGYYNLTKSNYGL